MSITTKKGDDGFSGLIGGERLSKNHPRFEALGTVDEALCAIGIVRSVSGDVSQSTLELLKQIQIDLSTVASDIASPDPEMNTPRVTSEMIRNLEAEIKKLETSLGELNKFIIPSGDISASACFFARTVVRRAERHVSVLLESGQRVAPILIYLNRLGDLLFLIARELNKEKGIVEESLRKG